MDGWTGGLTDGEIDRKMDEQIHSWVDIFFLLANNDKRRSWIWIREGGFIR